VQPLKHAEQLAGIGHLESHAVVLDGETNLALGTDRADPDDGLFPRTGELHRVGEEVGEGHFDETGIDLDGG
jgi:hypothetical protein